ncbi:MAG: transcriptional regulator [Candidatus Jacksonbacteria bacterium RIFCSPLOWO2_02_FULL_43_9]|nr:MAG: transcriptional regulator [Parcubacteria group bacterium GW2011_GWA2_43_13]OGY70775.1 MAG: transcriptional regulator [Candidatus Jacksonbacteria bacterium RIFCSPLOWO2_01_FULL_44_13]OGY72937.1 MAG: transcriptional regulator [Candidatus Jacksonbacteria bacterium RIFCSPLOWO2_02_FULL_43_9]HAZ16765.1 YebC/PmpR family DNA-binding transcriptional regulator [Candidatus Jacksonbacteria bacterium]
MSGHSKWASIKHKKGATDQKRGILFSRISKNIIIAAKHGGGDPATNLTLRLAIDAARSANMPNDNIKRAIDRATGKADGAQIEEVLYEGFGPGGVAVLVSAATDNKNRTTGNVRHLFSKYGGSMGTTNSVAWMFEQRGVIRIEKPTNIDGDDFQLQLIDAGAEDISLSDDGIRITTPPSDLIKIKNSIEQMSLPVEYAQIEYIPKQIISIDAETQAKIDTFFEALEEDEDVSNYYSNLEE